MLNNIKKENYDIYYDKEKFKEANLVFESYLNSCTINLEKMSFEDFNISTITTIIKIADKINIKVLYEQIPLSNDIIYLEFNDTVKGKRNKKKLKDNKSSDKRMKKKGKCFSNQLSIGFNCKEHYHKKPICVKIFSKGSLTVTGVKSNEEIKRVLEKLYELINNIKTEYRFNDKIIQLYPYENLFKVEDIKINIETINGSFKCNFNINLKNMKKIISSKYKDGEIYIKNNRPALIELDLLFYKNYDKRKNKDKTPKLSIYGTGSIVINSINEKILYKSYEFIKKFITDNYNDVIDMNYEFNL